MAGFNLRDALTEAATHAKAQRASGRFVELFVVPVGVGVGVFDCMGVVLLREEIIKWDVIEHTTFNVLIKTIDELIADVDKQAAPKQRSGGQ